MIVHFIFVFCSLFAFTASIRAQDNIPSWYVGPYGALIQSYHNSDFSELPGYPSCCTNTRSGTGLGYDIGLLFHVPLNQYGFRLFAGVNNPSATIYSDE
ncbi:MAG: hypothetical protein RLZZ578_1743, partial [Bacteroidota bacterium]